MNRRQIDRFFRKLSQRFDRSATIILTGAAAGSLLGRVRPTLDLDFALKLKGPPRAREDKWKAFARAICEVSQQTGIAVQYAEDIDGWSSITFLDYTRRTHLYRRFGKLEVRLLDPAYWAIGKITRYLDPDVRDLIAVIKKQKVSSAQLARVLGRALRHSPRSTACSLFRRHVESFFSTSGRTIWGRQFKPEAAIRLFHRFAGIKS